jgi:nucleoside-diphosphate-sugar epimerase
MGWRHRIGLREGIEDTYQWYLQNQGNLRLSTVASV